MGIVSSRRRQEREMQDFFENHTTGSLTPPNDEEEEGGEEVEHPYAIERLPSDEEQGEGEDSEHEESQQLPYYAYDPLYYYYPPGDPARRRGAIMQHSVADDGDFSSVAPSGDAGPAEEEPPDGNDVIAPPSPAVCREPDDELPAIQELAEAPRGKASLVLANNSIYTVSYSVIREDKMRGNNGQHDVSEVLERNFARNSANNAQLLKQASLKNTAVGRLLARLEEEAEEDTLTSMEEDDAEHFCFLMRDHRMAPVGE